MKRAVSVGSLLILLAGCSESSPEPQVEAAAVAGDARLTLTGELCLDQNANIDPWTIGERLNGRIKITAAPETLGVATLEPEGWGAQGLAASVAVATPDDPQIYPVASFERLATIIAEGFATPTGDRIEGDGWSLVRYGPSNDLLDAQNRVQCSESSDVLPPEKSFVRCLSVDAGKARSIFLYMNRAHVPELPKILTSLRTAADKLAIPC